MTVDTKEQSDNGASPAASEGTKLPNGYTRLPNGIILDKEGKP
jgi:hypothetical protein